MILISEKNRTDLLKCILTIIRLSGILIMTIVMGNCSEEVVPSGNTPGAAVKITVQLTDSVIRLLKNEPLTDTSRLSIYGARGEWVSFQLFVESDANAILTNLECTDFHSSGGTALPSPQIFREHAVNLQKGAYRNPDFEPGEYPDALIPVVQNPVNTPRFTAFPVDLVPGKNQGFWFDLYIPANTSPGEYTSSIVLKFGDLTVDAGDVTLTVWDFVLPEKSSLPVTFGEPTRFMRSYYSSLDTPVSFTDSQWKQTAEQCRALLKEHRITPDLTFYDFWINGEDRNSDGSFSVTPENMVALQQFIDTCQPAMIEVPVGRSMNVHQMIFEDPNYNYRTYQSADFTTDGKNRLAGFLNSWEQVISDLTNTDGILFYLYLCDEPNEAESYRFIQDVGTYIRSLNLAAIKVLVVEKVETDNPDWGNLDGAVDIWCPPFSSNSTSVTNARRALGEKVFTYTAMDHYNRPVWLLDYPLINYRLAPWIIWNNDSADGLLYWALTYWRDIPTQDPWTDVRSWPSDHINTYNGEGFLLYPGRDIGILGTAPSIRLKTVRDSLEDFEYFVLAESLGLSAEVRSLIDPAAHSWDTFNTDPLLIKSIRISVGELLDSSL